MSPKELILLLEKIMGPRTPQAIDLDILRNLKKAANIFFSCSEPCGHVMAINRIAAESEAVYSLDSVQLGLLLRLRLFEEDQIRKREVAWWGLV